MYVLKREIMYEVLGCFSRVSEAASFGLYSHYDRAVDEFKHFDSSMINLIVVENKYTYYKNGAIKVTKKIRSTNQKGDKNKSLIEKINKIL